jgi:hypothetical protein
MLFYLQLCPSQGSARGNKIAIFRRWTAKAVLFNAPSRNWTLPWNWGG